MKKLIKETISTYNKYAKLNSKDYKDIVEYLKSNGLILVLKQDNIFDDRFIDYVFEVGEYYLNQGRFEDDGIA